MKNEEYMSFLRSVLVKMENAINLAKQKPPKHIPAYNKMLGVQQKFAELDQEGKNLLFSNIVNTRSIINYFMNGYYTRAYDQMLKLKTDLVNIYLEIENEKNTIKKS